MTTGQEVYLSPTPSTGACENSFEPPPPPMALKSSGRVTQLFLERDLEPIRLPFASPLSAADGPTKPGTAQLPFLQMQPCGDQESSLMNNALQRMRERQAHRTPLRTVVLHRPSGQRKHPTLPTLHPSSPKEVEAARTPLRNPPERSNSGLARCA
jgi:hypothetical protein